MDGVLSISYGCSNTLLLENGGTGYREVLRDDSELRKCVFGEERLL